MFSLFKLITVPKPSSAELKILKVVGNSIENELLRRIYFKQLYSFKFARRNHQREVFFSFRKDGKSHLIDVERFPNEALELKVAEFKLVKLDGRVIKGAIYSCLG